MPLLALLFGLLLLEGGLRLLGYDPLGQLAGGRAFFLRESDHPELAYELTPGAEGVVWGQRVAINSHGFRDREYALEKPPGVRRVVVIGDSIPFGNRLAVEQTFPELLERMAQRSGRRVEVLNLGVDGYDTHSEIAFLEKVGLPFRPDWVVVSYSINDLGVHSMSLSTVRLLEHYGPLIQRFRVLQLVTVGFDRARLTRSLWWMSTREPARDPAEAGAALRPDPELRRRVHLLRAELDQTRDGNPSRFLRWHASQRRVANLRRAFVRLRELAERNAFEVAVVIVPVLDERGHGELYRAAYDIVARAAAGEGFRVVDMHAEFAAYGLEALKLRPTDRLHPNENGHRLIARRLLRELDAPKRTEAALP